MRRRLIAFVGGLALGLILILPGRAVAEATCTTFNAASEPATAFRAGETLTIRGAGFAPRAVVLVSIVQGSRSIDLDRPAATDLGAFTASDVPLPSDLVSGKASIRAIDARGSATCGLTVIAAAAETGDGSGGLLVAWGVLLAAVAVFLAVLTWRRYKAQKINSAMQQLGWEPSVSDITEDHPVYDAPVLERPSVDPLPLRRVPPPPVHAYTQAPGAQATGRPERESRRKAASRAAAPLDAVMTEERPPADPYLDEPADGDADEWFYGGPTVGRARAWRDEQVRGAVARPAGRARPPAPAARAGAEPHPLAAYGYVDDAELEFPDEPVAESGSEAIERLRREVQSWKRP